MANNEVNIAVKTDVASTTTALGALNKQFTDAGTKAAASLNNQIAPALKNVGDTGESNFNRVGRAANMMSMNVYYASYAFMPFAAISPIFGFLSDAISGASGSLSLMGPILETVGSKSQKTAVSVQAVGDATAASSAKADAAMVTQAAVAEATAATVEGADADMVAASEASEAAMGPLGFAVAAVGVAAGVAAGLVGVFGGSQKATISPIDSVTTALEQQAGAFGDVSRQAIATQVSTDKNFQSAGKLGLTVASLTDGLNGNANAYAANVAQLQQIIASGTKTTTVMGGYKGMVAQTTTTQTASAKQAQQLLTDYRGLNAQIQASSTAATTYSSALGNVAAAEDAVGTAATVASAELTALQSAAAGLDNANLDVAQSQADLTEQMASYNQTTGSTKKAVQAVVNVTQDYETAIDELSGNTLSAVQGQDQFQLSLLGLKDALAGATPTNEQTSDVKEYTVGALNNKEAVLQQIAAINSIAKAQLAAGDATSSVTSTMADNEKQLETAAAAAGLNAAEVNALVKAYAVNPAALGPKVKSDEAATAAAAAKQTDAYSGAVDGNTHSLAQNNAQAIAWITSTKNLIQQEIIAHDPMSQINADLQTNYDKLYQTMTQAGLTKAQIAALIKAYGLTPDEIQTTVTLNVDKAYASLDTMAEKLKLIDQLATTDPTDAVALGKLYQQEITAVAGATRGAHSSGGPWGAAAGGVRGGWGTMNEQGTEAVKLPTGSMVFSHADTQRMIGGGSGGQVSSLTFEFTGNTDAALSQWFQGALRSGQIVVHPQYVH